MFSVRLQLYAYVEMISDRVRLPDSIANGLYH